MNRICIVDTREPEKVEKRLADKFTVTRQFLQFGDVYVPPRLGIERKTATDLLHTMSEGRLIRQLNGLSSSYTVPVLLIEGTLRANKSGFTVANGQATKWPFVAVQALLWKAQINGIIVVNVKLSEFASTVATLARLADEAERVVNPARHMRVKEDRAEAILTLFPNVGKKLAKHLLRYAGTLGWALAALTDETVRVQGVGVKTREEARKILGLKPKEEIVIVRREDD